MSSPSGSGWRGSGARRHGGRTRAAGTRDRALAARLLDRLDRLGEGAQGHQTIVVRRARRLEIAEREPKALVRASPGDCSAKPFWTISKIRCAGAVSSSPPRSHAFSGSEIVNETRSLAPVSSRRVIAIRIKTGTIA